MANGGSPNRILLINPFPAAIFGDTESVVTNEFVMFIVRMLWRRARARASVHHIKSNALAFEVIELTSSFCTVMAAG